MSAEEEKFVDLGIANGNPTTNGDLTTPSPPVNGRDGQPRKKRELNDMIIKLIQECKDRGSVVLDLNNKSLRKIPDELLELSHLEVEKNCFLFNFKITE